MNWKNIFILLMPAISTVQANTVVDGHNQFAFELLTKIKSPQKSAVYSPYSVWSVLAMLSTGARNNTLKELNSTLHLSNNYQQENLTLMQELQKPSPVEVTVANGLWVKQNSPIEEAFKKTASEQFMAQIEVADFAHNPDMIRQKINKWVEQKTKNKIQDLIPQDSLSKTTESVLVNACYFKADWKSPFMPDVTKATDFTTESGQIKKVPMMKQKHHVEYAEDSQATYLEMPYKGDDYTMSFVLPNKDKPIQKFITEFNFKKLQKLRSLKKTEFVDVQIPKFKSEIKYFLKDPIQELKLKELFDGKKANLEGIRQTQPNNRLFVSQIIHQVYIAVDEKGTEAAAATAMSPEGALIKPNIKSFIANRPFLYAIMHKKTGMILFLGVYSE